METTLAPFVYWAQTETNIILKVDLRKVTKPLIATGEKIVTFEAVGLGARGFHTYKFMLNLCKPINPDGTSFKVFDNKVDVIMPKVEKRFWTRLTPEKDPKPIWLKIDFDRFQTEENFSENEEKKLPSEKEVYEKFREEEMDNMKNKIFKYLKIYLTSYYALCFSGFLYVLLVLIFSLFLKTPVLNVHTGEFDVGLAGIFTKAFEKTGIFMQVLVALQCVELIHAYFGLAEEILLVTAMIMGGRCLMFYLLILPDERIQESGVVYFLFITWCLSEIVKCSYAILNLHEKNGPFMTWIRFTIWIPLFPLGAVCEALIIYKNIVFADGRRMITGTSDVGGDKLVVEGNQPLLVTQPPNFFNFNLTFTTSTFLRIYLLVYFIPGAYTLMSFMHKIRQEQLKDIRFSWRETKFIRMRKPKKKKSIK